MRDVDIVRAWKDEAYRDSLPEEVRAQLPQNPAGIIDLGDDALALVTGGLEAPPQTGTNADAACWCEKTRTANSDDGSCWCTC